MKTKTKIVLYSLSVCLLLSITTLLFVSLGGRLELEIAPGCEDRLIGILSLIIINYYIFIISVAMGIALVIEYDSKEKIKANEIFCEIYLDIYPIFGLIFINSISGLIFLLFIAIKDAFYKNLDAVVKSECFRLKMCYTKEELKESISYHYKLITSKIRIFSEEEKLEIAEKAKTMGEIRNNLRIFLDAEMKEANVSYWFMLRRYIAENYIATTPIPTLTHILIASACGILVYYLFINKIDVVAERQEEINRIQENLNELGPDAGGNLIGLYIDIMIEILMLVFGGG